LLIFGAGEGKLSVRLGFIPQVKEILAVEPTEKCFYNYFLNIVFILIIDSVFKGRFR